METDRKHFLYIILVIAICSAIGCSGCGGCEEDEFGDRLELQVPIRSYPDVIQFDVGDTLFWEADFSKDVAVLNHESSIYLEDFTFFSVFAIAEISSEDTIDFNRRVELVPLVGQIESYEVTQDVYPFKFREEEDRYRLSFGVVLEEPGFYTAGFSLIALPEDFDHPAAFECEDRFRRTFIEIHYLNESTSKNVYEDLYLSSPNQDIQRLATFERYRQTGSITFRVVP